MEQSKTKQYDIFIFRDDNREKIIQVHVKKLVASIKENNLLEFAPILVNGNMEIIDGQHRLLAAKQLGVDIYYRKEQTLKASDIIILNMSQKWGLQDYLNYYCKNNYPEYIKLQNFMKQHNVQVRVALNITMTTHTMADMDKYRKGEYVYNHDEVGENIQICWETIDYIKKINGTSMYTQSAKFWGALLQLTRHSDFDAEKWRDNLKRMVERFTTKTSKEDYLRMFLDVHNWKNRNKMELLDA